VEEIPPASGFNVYNAEKQHYTLVSDTIQLAELANALKNAPAFCFDAETTGTDPLTADLVGLAFSFEAGKGYYLPWKGAIPENEIRKALDAVFSSTAEKVGHNVKYDLQVLMKQGFTVNGPFFDTMIAAFLCDTEAMLSMDELSKRWLQYEPIPISRLIGTGKNQITMDKVDVQQVCIYAAEDADITFQLYGKLKERLVALELERVAKTVEFPLIPVLAQMELDGVALDVPMLKAFSKELEAAMLEMEEKIFAQTGVRFNLNSPAQLGEILFERLKLSHGRKTATGKYSTSEDVLVQLAATHEVPAMVLEYRSLAKLKSTYVDAFPQMVDAQNRIHTTFNQAVASTGRLSSSNPNLQNIPIRTEKGQEVRKAFIAAPGHLLISADYSQIELRIIAELSGDEAMMEAFVSGEDIHAHTAKGIFGLKTLDEVTREHRRKAKEVNFGIPYGVSAYGLAQRLGLKNDEGKEIIKAYFTRFPKVKEYINTTVQFARDHGYVTTLTGRRRTIPGIHSRNVNERGFAERTAINTPIQGSAADLIKLAMISVFSALKQAGLKTRMVLQIHDELLFEAPEEEVPLALPIIRKSMETAMPLKVPIVVDIGTGKNWLEAH
jgi:DNA polymerase-1